MSIDPPSKSRHVLFASDTLPTITNDEAPVVNNVEDVVMSNNDTDTEENMVDYSNHPLSDDEAPKIGAQLARDETMFYPINTMSITLNSKKGVFDVDNNLMTTEKEVIERLKQDNFTPVSYSTKIDNERKKPITSNANKQVINLVNDVLVTKDKENKCITSKSNEDALKVLNDKKVYENEKLGINDYT